MIASVRRDAATQHEGQAMPLKTILVFLDCPPAGQPRARYAANLARRHGAHLVGVYVAPSGWQGDHASCFARGQDAIREVIERHKAEETSASQAALQSFKALTEREGINFDFRIIREGDANEDGKLHSLHADLVISGFPGPGGLPYNWSPEDMLLATGVPLLIVPETWNSNSVGEHIVVGWNASREARRAIADSLPLLIAARSVCVVLVDGDDNARDGQTPGADIAQYLSRHGAKVEVEQTRSADHSVADVLQMAVQRHNGDMLVVGAYSHSRPRQTLFGGVTRSLLSHVAVPLLIAH